MGNNQSTLDPRDPHRLSKPRTYTNGSPSSNASQSKKDLRLSTSRLTLSAIIDGETAVESPAADRKSRQGIMPLFRSQQSLNEVADEDADEDSLGALAVTVKDRLSRSGSRATKPPSAKSSATQLNSASLLSLPAEKETRAVDLETAVAILQELRKTASPEDLVALHKALLPTRPLDQPPPSRESNVESSAAALIRRKSLAIPGLATRHASKIEQQRTSTVLEEEENIWKPEMICASPLARLSSLDATGKISTAFEMPPRAETPGELDYAQLGNMKLGSLVVTNGMASPAPSIASHPKTPKYSATTPNQEDDFFTASEGESAKSPKTSTEFGPPLRAPPPPPNDFDQASSIFDRRGRTQQRGRNVGRPVQPRDGSPLKYEVRAESPKQGSLSSVRRRPLPERQPRSVRSAISLLTDDTRYSSDDDLHQPTFAQPTDMNQSATSLASEYIAGLPSSPFASTGERVPNFGAAIRYRTAASEQDVDEGYYDASPGIEEQRQAALAVLDGIPNKPVRIDEITPQTALRSHPPQAAPLQTSLRPKRPVQTKSDSGYSSGASANGIDTRIAYGHGAIANMPSTPTAAPRPSVDEFNDSYTPEGEINQPSFGQVLKEEPTSLPYPPAVTNLEMPKGERPKVERSKSWKKSMRKSLPRLVSNGSTATAATKSSKASSSDKTAPRKLQKSRPHSHQPLSFRNPHHLDGVPRVPSAVFSRFSGRLADKPEMDHLDRTYENFSGPTSKQQPEDVESEQFDNHYRFPDSEDEYTAPQRTRPARADPERPPPTPPHRFGLRRALSKPRLRKKMTAEKEDEILNIADMGDVMRHVGSSPYDVAALPVSRRPSSGAQTYPHQMSSNQPASGPVTGMDDETASRFAQMKSQLRAAKRERMETQGRPSMGNRPRSFHESSLPVNSFDDRSSAPARRSRSMHGEAADAPMSMPVPRLRPRSIGPTPGRGAYGRLAADHEQIPLPQLTSLPHQLPDREISPEYAPADTGSEMDVRASRTSPPVQPPPVSRGPLDWSAQASVWRQRRLDAKNTVETTTSCSPTASGVSTTTTTVTGKARSPLPSIPKRANPFVRRSGQSTTDPVPITKTLSSTTVTTTTIGTASLRPKSAGARQGEYLPPVAKYAEEGLFGRYGGGLRYGGLGLAGKRDVTHRTGAFRDSFGVDLGDIPSFG